MKELEFTPAPGSLADIDYDQWQRYLKVCEQDGTRPRISDYLVWLDEQE